MTAKESDPDRVVDSLRVVVQGEARRTLSESQLAPDPVLTAAGWSRRFIADPQRTREATDLYTQLGFEVRAEPLTPEELGDDCSDCQLLLLGFRTIYTRRKDST